MRTYEEIMAAAMNQDRVAWGQRDAQSAEALVPPQSAARGHAGDVMRQAMARRLIALANILTPPVRSSRQSAQGVHEPGP